MFNDRFPTAATGYRRDEVDAFMARLEGTFGLAPLTAPPVTVEELGRARFHSAAPGYDQDAIDLTLREAAKVLGGTPGQVGPFGYVSAPGPVAPPPGYAPPAGPGAPSPGAPPGRPAGQDAWLARVRDIRFPTTRIRAGYAVEDVDAFLDRVQAALSGAAPPLTPQEIRGVAFSTTMLRRGYDEQEVDGFLDELEAYVAGRDRYMG